MRIIPTILLTFLFFILSLPAFAQETSYPKNIKSITAWKADNPKATNGPMMSYKGFDMQGNNIRTERYSDGSLNDVVVYEYNIQGELVKKLNYKPNFKPLVQSYLFDEKTKKQSIDSVDIVLVSKSDIRCDKKGHVTQEIQCNPQGGVLQKNEYKYSKSGKMVVELKSQSDSIVSSKKILHYDRQDNLIKETIFHYDIVKSKKSFKYDEKGNKIEEEFYTSGNTFGGQNYEDNNGTEQVNNVSDDGHMFSRVTYKYDEKNAPIEKIIFKEDGSILQKATFKYNEKGLTIEAIECHDGEIVFSISRNKYDSKGNLIEDVSITSYPVLFKTITYEYNDNNGVVSEVQSSMDNSLSQSREFFYREDGKLEKEIWNQADGGFGYKKSYLYDKKGNLAEENWLFSEGGGGSRKTFQYDENGNIIEEVTHTANETPQRVKYVYEYY